MLRFDWDDWNVGHVAEHGVSPEEAEDLVKHARSPFPKEIGDDKYAVWGKTRDGRYLQVVFVYRSDEQVDVEGMTLEELLALSAGADLYVYVIHAMDLTPKMLKQYRKLKGRR